MSVTKLNDLINPQVMQDMIGAKIEALLKFTKYAKVDTTLEGVEGDTVTVPSWDYIGDAEDYDVEGGAGIDTTNLSASTTTYTIKTAAKGLSIYQTAINSGKGKPIAQAEKQLGMAIAGKVDNDVLGAVYGAKSVYASDTLAKIGYDGIVDANSKFEDEEDDIEKVMFIHPNQEATLLKDENFKSKDKFDGNVVVRGAIGKISGNWIKKSKKVKLVQFEKDNENGTVTITAENLNEYNAKSDVLLAVGDKVKAVATASQYYLNPIIKLEPDSAETEYTEDELPAVTIYLKKNTQLDHDWVPKFQRHDFYATRYYGVALTNGAKVLLCKFKK